MPYGYNDGKVNFMRKKVIVIGAGPAGIMAGITAARQNKEVIVIEKNDQIGKKLRITGGGRCNLTNACSISEMIEKTLCNGKFLYPSFNAFSNMDLIHFVESNGCKVKIESKGKVFPLSDRSQDIIDLFLRVLNQYNAVVRTQHEVKDILTSENTIVGVQLRDGLVLECDSVIIATGGMSYPHLGSTGDGYTFAQTLGHRIVDLKPSLVPIAIKEEWIDDLMGISLKDVRIISKVGNKKKIETEGDLIFTHYGISGPAVLEHSAYLNKYAQSSGSIIKIDLLPSYQYEDLELIFKNESMMNGSKLVRSILGNYLPKNLSSKLLNLLEVEEDLRLRDLSKKDRNKLIHIIKELELTVSSFRSIKEATITSGGIPINEIDSKTMESKVIKGLYFAGEIIDVDAITGGYNLQIAFSTGYVAGMNA